LFSIEVLTFKLYKDLGLLERMEKTMSDRFTTWKHRIFDFALFILFLVAIAKLLYYEIWG